MSKSTRNIGKFKLNFYRIRHKKADYIKHFVQKITNYSKFAVVGGTGFLAAAIIFTGINGASAAPSSTPTSGNVNARFDSVTVKNDANIEKNIYLGTTTTRNADTTTTGPSLYTKYLYASGLIGSQYHVNVQHGINFGTQFTRDIYASNEITSAKDIIAQANIKAGGKITSAVGIGSYFKVAAIKTADAYPLNTRREISISCPVESQLVACSGYIYDTNTTPALAYLGTEKSTSPTTRCRSYVKRIGSATVTSSTSHYVEAYCFDPTGTITQDRATVNLNTTPTTIHAPQTTLDTTTNFINELNINMDDLNRPCTTQSNCLPGVPNLLPSTNPVY